MKTLSAIIAAAIMLHSVSAVSTESEAETVLPIIMYHHISEDAARWGDYVVSPETLEGDLAYLAAHGYKTVSLRQLLDYSGGAELPEKPVMLSFDDGQLSFCEYALPLLEKYDMCALVAVVGSYADEFSASGDANPAYAYMSWEKLAELARNPRVDLAAHSFGLHSLHPRCGAAPMRGEGREEYRAMLFSDLRKLNSRFGAAMGRAPRAFVYPFGQYNAVSEEALRDAGYLFTFTCEEKRNKLRRGDGFFALGRFNRPAFLPREEFFARALGA